MLITVNNKYRYIAIIIIITSINLLCDSFNNIYQWYRANRQLIELSRTLLSIHISPDEIGDAGSESLAPARTQQPWRIYFSRHTRVSTVYAN